MGGCVPAMRRTGEAHTGEFGVQGMCSAWPGELTEELPGVRIEEGLELVTLLSSTPKSFKISLRSRPSFGGDGVSRSASSVVVEHEAAGEFARVLATEVWTIFPGEPSSRTTVGQSCWSITQAWTVFPGEPLIMPGLLGQMMLGPEAVLSSRTTVGQSWSIMLVDMERAEARQLKSD